MLKIRLSMGGAKKRPVYKIVVADSRFHRDGRFIEKLGFFNPLVPKNKKDRVKLEVERIKHWMSQGAKPTIRVARILGEAEIIPMPTPGNNSGYNVNILAFHIVNYFLSFFFSVFGAVSVFLAGF
jgi:small subunit ribosomal protein S16